MLSKHARIARATMWLSAAIFTLSVFGVGVFGGMAGDTFPYVQGLAYEVDLQKTESQSVWQWLEWSCWVLVIGSGLLGLGSFARYKFDS